MLTQFKIKKEIFRNTQSGGDGVCKGAHLEGWFQRIGWKVRFKIYVYIIRKARRFALTF